MTAGLDFRMDFYTKDFLASTLAMTGPERGAFAVALIVAWTQAASLPADPERIARMCGYGPEEWAGLWPALEAKWPLTRDGASRRNPRQAAMWKEATVRVQKAHEKGKKMAGVRWQDRPVAPDAASNAASTAPASPKQCPSPSPSPPSSPSSSPSPSPSPSSEGGAGGASSLPSANGGGNSKPAPLPEPLSNIKITNTAGVEWAVPYSSLTAADDDGRLDWQNDEIETALKDLALKTKISPKHRPEPGREAEKVANWLSKAIEIKERDDAKRFR
jgi:uncharacterized protein YdaU (DUF1376 family)